MNHQTHYATVSKAIEELHKQGYTTDFNLEGNGIVCNVGRLGTSEFEVVDVYRYEGDSDPGDEAAVYAIKSSNGLKGILVTGYGASAENMAPDILRKLSNAYRK